MVWVPGEGPRETAKLAFIGEGPGTEELRTGRPFQGDAGRQLNSCLEYAGIRRDEVYITNTVKWTDQTPTAEMIEKALPGLLKELAGLPACNVFVPLGASALSALSAWKYQGIVKHRGSILPTCFGGKMVPTVHPAWYMRGEWRYKPVVIQDFKRAKEQSAFQEIRLPERIYTIRPTFEEAIRKLREYRTAEFLSIDIETFGRHIACVGFAPTPLEATCIPIMRAGGVPYWTLQEEAAIWREIAILLAGPAKKIFQNGCFDIRKFAELGFEVANIWVDTLLAHHLLRPELPHGLDFICSIYSLEPYYKEEGKTWSHTMPEEQLWIYNCKDCCATLEAAFELAKDLREEGQWEYFEEWVMPLVGSTLGMTMRGILVDKKALAEANEFVTTSIARDQAELDKLVGFSMNVKAPTSLEKFFKAIGIPERDIRRTEKSRMVKHDDKTLRLLQSHYQHPGWDLIFNITENRTLLSNFLQLKTDGNDFYHPLYKPHGTKFGRYSSEGADEGGPQIQNIPEPTRNIFIARAPEMEFCSIDEAGAEAWIVAFDSQDPTLMAFLKEGRDVHKFYASIIFNRTNEWIAALTPEEYKAWKRNERYPAKRIGHGTNYRMSARRIVTELRAEGIFIQEGDAKRWQGVYLATFPGVRAWQNDTELSVRRTRLIVTPFGRKIPFIGLLDDEAIRSAISAKPQSTVAEIAKRAQLKLDKWLPEINGCVRTQTHDSLLLEYPKTQRARAVEMMDAAFDIPVTLHGRTFVIPVEKSFGPNWRDVKDAA